ncbi:hypothetical protein JZ751_017123 [Albula glossodonta]|uniref:G-protein coupled receptors family 1 profile domain-containing protein n=1 Tax=Albula glossodonta TaxID=121402 RepID=A0A8T2NPX9_9TELE|nr:hypothetical protein JZ751_017123 [Albula glossodonta]
MEHNETCENTEFINADGNPVVSTLMFIAGVGGNLTALAILGVHQKERRTKSSVFCILVTGLAVTDLLGTCFLSPLVFVCYARKASLLGLAGDQRLCKLFAFAMTFFGLASMLILCAMAVERCMAISHPYLYTKFVRRSFAKVTLLLIYLFTCAFCSLPFMGMGRYRQYCPGTWCFIKMEAGDEGAEEGRWVLAFSLSYASLMALLIAAVFICNGSVIVSLCRMHRSQLSRRGSVLSAGRKRKMGLWFGQGEEEVDHLVLLASMTVIFVICSLPLTEPGCRVELDLFPQAALLCQVKAGSVVCVGTTRLPQTTVASGLTLQLKGMPLNLPAQADWNSAAPPKEPKRSGGWKTQHRGP